MFRVDIEKWKGCRNGIVAASVGHLDVDSPKGLQVAKNVAEEAVDIFDMLQHMRKGDEVVNRWLTPPK